MHRLSFGSRLAAIGLRATRPPLNPSTRPALRFVASSTRTRNSTPLPSLKDRIAEEKPAPSLSDTLRSPSWIRHIAITGIAATVLYVTCAERTQDDSDYWLDRLDEQGGPQRTPGLASIFFGKPTPSSGDIRLLRLQNEAKDLQETAVQLRESNLPLLLKAFISNTHVTLAQQWLNSNEGKRAAYVICAVNAGIWLMWKVPRLRPFMQRHFLHDPLSGRWHTLVTSVFSHNSFMHMAVNNIALVGFASTTSHWMVVSESRTAPQLPESTTLYHFIAFYLTSGAFASLASHIFSARFVWPRLVGKSLSKTTRSILPGLGASGAVYACLGLTAMAFPTGEVSLLFLPFTMHVSTAFLGLVAFDAIGAVTAWRLGLDHIAHLGGAAFGYLYWKYGMQYWWVPWRDAAQAVADEMLEEELKELEADEKESEGKGVEFGPVVEGKEKDAATRRTSGGKGDEK